VPTVLASVAMETFAQQVHGSQTRGELVAAISSAMVRAKKEFYGRGPTKAKTFINENYVFCVLEGGLTKNEETLLKADEEDLVRRYRLRFQEVTADELTRAVEEITQREVVSYHSQIVFSPVRIFEIFVLDRTLSEPEAEDSVD
jgi:uncharacterized protein YbcI